MFVRLEKINHLKRQRRFYQLSLERTLFGEWVLIREWGRMGSSGGRRLVEYFPTFDATKHALADLKQTKERRGYGVIPVQLKLPFA